MRLPEQKLWDRMRKGMSKFHIYLERLENMVGSGFPDVCALKNRHVSYLELKVARNGIPKRPNTPLLGKDGLRLAQLNWMLNWYKHGGRAMVVIGIAGSKRHIAISGFHADVINHLSYTELCNTAELYGDSPFFWRYLYEYL